MTSPWKSDLKLEDLCVPANAPRQQIHDVLVRAGGVLLKGMLTPEQVSAMRGELQPHLDALGGNQWGGSFFPSTTKKLSGLATKSPTWVDNCLLSPVLGDIADFVLTRRTKVALSNPPKWSTSKPELNLSGTFEIHPGGQRQELHRDDALWHQPCKSAAEWNPRREQIIVTLTALAKVTKKNGGTYVIPESHLKGDDLPPPSYDDAIKIEMDPGDCFAFLGSTYHAGGSNESEDGDPDSIRTVVVTAFKCGYLKQEENQYLQHNIEDVKKLSWEAQRMIGWNLSLPYLGYVNWLHPKHTLGYGVEDVPTGDDLFWDAHQGPEVVPA